MKRYNPFKSQVAADFYLEANLVLKRILVGKYNDRISFLYQEVMEQKFRNLHNPSIKQLLDVTEAFIREHFGYATGLAVRQAYASLKLPLIPQTSKQIFYPNVEILQDFSLKSIPEARIIRVRTRDKNA